MEEDEETDKRIFSLLNFSQSLFLRLQLLQQGDRTIDSSTEEFHHLVGMNDVIEVEERLAA